MRVRFRKGSLKYGYYDQGWQQARKLLNIDMHGEAATRHGTSVGQMTFAGGMKDDSGNAMSIHLWASLVPAAAVIPAQVAYFDVVAVKKLVVGWHPGELPAVPQAKNLTVPMAVNLWCPLNLQDLLLG